MEAGDWEIALTLPLRARFYDPSVGRFISSDPFGGFAERPISLNKYLYGDANPISNIDPSGLFSLMEHKLAAAFSVTIGTFLAFHGPRTYLKYGAGYSYMSDPYAFAKDYRLDIIASANRYKFEPEYLAAFIIVELNDLERGKDLTRDLYPLAFGGSGSLGVAQLSLEQIKEMYPDAGLFGRRRKALNPADNIEIIAAILRKKADNYIDVARDSSMPGPLIPDRDTASFFFGGEQLDMLSFSQPSSSWSNTMRRAFGFVHDHGNAFFSKDLNYPGRYKYDRFHAKNGESADWGDQVLRAYLELKNRGANW